MLDGKKNKLTFEKYTIMISENCGKLIITAFIFENAAKRINNNERLYSVIDYKKHSNTIIILLRNFIFSCYKRRYLNEKFRKNIT